MEQSESQAENLARRKSCIFRLVLIWLGIGAGIVGLMIFTRKLSVNRDPEILAAELDHFLDYRVPDGFYLYSRTNLMGVRLYTFWNEAQVRDDGRTTSVLAVYLDERWRDLTLDQAKTRFFEDLPERLNKREFSVKTRSTETVVREGRTMEVEVFRGVQLMDSNIVEATATYRFMLGPDGPFYVHGMGLNQNFGPDLQIEALLGFQAK